MKTFLKGTSPMWAIPENIMRAAAVLTGIVLAVKLGCSTYF